MAKEIEFIQVPKELVNDVQIKADLYDTMYFSRHRPSFYWKKFSVWKAYFKQLNPDLASMSASERNEVYTEMYSKFITP